MGRLSFEHGLVGFDGLAHVFEPRFVDVAEPDGERQLAAGVISFAGQPDLGLEQLGELFVEAVCFVELGQEYDRIGLARIVLEDAAQGLDGVLARARVRCLRRPSIS